MSKINLQVGKTYTTRGGDTVEIKDRAGNTFSGLVTRRSRPQLGDKFYRTYNLIGRIEPLHTVTLGLGDQRDDIIAEHIEKPPFRLKVGNVYPTRDGTGFGVVIFTASDSANVLLFEEGRSAPAEVLRWQNGRKFSDSETPLDLVDEPFKDRDAVRRAMATREAINLAFDIANGKRAVFKAATSNDTIPRIQFDGRDGDDLIVSRTHEFTGHGFSITVEHKRKAGG